MFINYIHTSNATDLLKETYSSIWGGTVYMHVNYSIYNIWYPRLKKENNIHSYLLDVFALLCCWYKNVFAQDLFNHFQPIV